MEVKLTAGPKKAGIVEPRLAFSQFAFSRVTALVLPALEHLRKKIELSAEKIKAAKVKEVQAKKVQFVYFCYAVPQTPLVMKVLTAL